MWARFGLRRNLTAASGQGMSDNLHRNLVSTRRASDNRHGWKHIGAIVGLQATIALASLQCLNREDLDFDPPPAKDYEAASDQNSIVLCYPFKSDPDKCPCQRNSPAKQLNIRLTHNGSNRSITAKWVKLSFS